MSRLAPVSSGNSLSVGFGLQDGQRGTEVGAAHSCGGVPVVGVLQYRVTSPVVVAKLCKGPERPIVKCRPREVFGVLVLIHTFAWLVPQSRYAVLSHLEKRPAKLSKTSVSKETTTCKPSQCLKSIVFTRFFPYQSKSPKNSFTPNTKGYIWCHCPFAE